MFDMSSTVEKRKKDILMEFGNGRKVGEQKQWPVKEQGEQEEQLMDIAIGYILLLCMRISWISILHRK